MNLLLSPWRRLARYLAVVVLACVLGACGKTVVLHAGLSDTDANEMLSVLQRGGVMAAKAPAKDGVALQVSEPDLARATELLTAAGLPRRQLSHLGQVFKKDGMISTPLEERARYIYGLSQELEYTLSQIDRVVVARVHVVLPERVAPGEPVQPSSASVFIKYREPLDSDLVTPRVRSLVAASIPGLSSEEGQASKVQVVMVPATQPADQAEAMGWERVAGFMVESRSAAALRTALALMALVIGLLLLVIVGAWSNRRFGWLGKLRARVPALKLRRPGAA
ncbi:type III secretion inner membrane ring lipoprotein SctJ [Aquabacterium sp. A7-Y]|uniref:type III secretion system inner membrane ring lipoprotein SctJ n=1 Tax=Aquabacterium sp. A7-Y TaxID=1349605 RepID=UPI00223DDF2D|nr:type III secretion inner membrane ring lipoprotein SctJ [Aquabacterium sp. A7-Y]MCW7536993.1 type III secretion inner membrane ring lipoprotein SctJ [Aquabacterium sp. A7-Y]